MFRPTLLPLAVVVALISLGGCTRARYRAAADRDSYWVLREKDQCAAWDIPSDYAVTPDPRARFFDPTCPDQPKLPVPAPRLNAYPLPPLASGLAPTPEDKEANEEKKPEAIPPPAPKAGDSQPSPSDQLSLNQPNALPPPANGSKGDSSPPSSPAPAPSNPLTTGMGSVPMRIVPIPTSAWEAIPIACVDRMMEFSSLRIEHARSFPNEPKRSKPSVQRLSLENLMELALINSREYQTRKEILYRTALAVTRQRYRYQLNPTPVGNGSAVAYRNLNVADRTVNTLSIPSQAAVQQTVASGGEFLARFANSVVLTFNGPQGFVADVGSELLFDFQQTVFQRDVRFELLTQAERDVVYAARDYIRFRKQLFRDISNQYYTLLLNYRNIEINSQDYFTNLRGFMQSKADYLEAERIPRIQVDQFEQNVLRTRSNLVNNYFTLESSLDQLKFRLGLPPEMELHLDLTELESLSARDEASVARQLIERSRFELTQSRSSPESDVATMVNYTIVLADRMANILRIQQRLLSTNSLAGQTDGSTKSEQDAKVVEQATKTLEEHVKLLGLLDARVQVDVLRMNLMEPLNTQPPAPPFYLFMRATDLCSALLQLSDLSIQNMHTPEDGMALRMRYNMLTRELEQLLATVDQMTAEDTPDKGRAVPSVDAIPELLKRSLELVKQADALTKDATSKYLPQEAQAFEMKVQLTVDKTLELCSQLLEHGVNGWEEMPVESNEAMLTALVQRLDLMNRRGDLADAWRQIKLAGDDLRSVMDLRATHILRTRSDNNSPFDFTFDDSETRVSMALDTPLNRRIQRNNYRLALIDYNVGLRNLIAAEDTIKLDVREDLRQLQLDRNQYNIGVASAALAYGRVLSTRARLAQGTQNVSARDFLEAQQAYTNALTTIARQHVNYIIDRTELFFDLEAFDVNDLGMWTGVRGESAPSMNTDFPSTNPKPYDSLPKRPWYSPTIREMEHVPPGQAEVHE